MKLSRAISALLVVLGVAGCAGTQETPHYPTQPVKIVVPYPEGNTADVFGRIVAGKLSELWGQPVTVENRPGGVSIPGVAAVAKSNPDGYTLLVHSISLAVNAGLYTNLPYDTEKDLVAVASFAKQPFVLAASPSLGVKNVAELIALAKTKPGQLKFGSLGQTTQVHFVAEQFRRQAGIEVGSVVFNSAPEVNAATAKGEVAFWLPPISGAMGGIREGKLVALAVTAEKRYGMLPQVPTMAESGIGNMEAAAWFGMWAPAGVSAGIVDKLSNDIARAIDAPDVREKFAKAGAEPMRMSPTQFSAFVRSEIDVSKRFVKELGIKLQTYTAPTK